MTLTPLIKITVVLCGRFEFVFYAMQLLHFKWISRYEKTNAYILIIYLFCINIYNEIHTFIFITFSSTSHIQPLAVKNWLKSMMKRNCVHSTKRGWHQKCQLTVLEMNGRYDDFTNKDRDIIWKLEPLACYFCFTFLEIIFCRGMFWELLEAMTNRDFPWNREFLPTSVWDCFSVKDIPASAPDALESVVESPSEDVL